MRASIAQVIDRIDNAAASPGDLPAVRLRKTLVIFLCAAGMLLVPWGAVYLYGEGMRLAAAVVLGYACLSVVAVAHLLITRNVAAGAALQLLGLLCLLQWTMGGYAASGVILLWALLAPLCAPVFQGTRAPWRGSPVMRSWCWPQPRRTLPQALRCARCCCIAKMCCWSRRWRFSRCVFS